jgi:hypothetical protein
MSNSYLKASKLQDDYFVWSDFVSDNQFEGNKQLKTLSKLFLIFNVLVEEHRSTWAGRVGIGVLFKGIFEKVPLPLYLLRHTNLLCI